MAQIQERESGLPAKSFADPGWQVAAVLPIWANPQLSSVDSRQARPRPTPGTRIKLPEVG